MAIFPIAIARESTVASYSVATAKNDLPSLIHRAQGGEHVVITRRGKPVAEIRPVVEATSLATTDGPKTDAEWDEWLRKRREARPRAAITSVELLNEMYDETPW